MDIKIILEKHYKWLNGEGGNKADLSKAGLGLADLSEADLRWADLSKADLRWADLSKADLSKADLRGANLSGADLRWAKLRWADLSKAGLALADLSGADLVGADLRWANLSGANLSGADLSEANLSGANLSGAKNFILAKEFLSQFNRTENSLIVFKAIGNTDFSMPDSWRIAEGEYLEETPNPDRATPCGSGVNFGTLEYIKNNYPNSDWWECLIEWDDLADVIVPFNTSGKARCARLKLIRKIN